MKRIFCFSFVVCLLCVMLLTPISAAFDSGALQLKHILWGTSESYVVVSCPETEQSCRVMGAIFVGGQMIGIGELFPIDQRTYGGTLKHTGLTNGDSVSVKVFQLHGETLTPLCDELESEQIVEVTPILNPLTGLNDGINASFLFQRPVAVMVDNAFESLPQWGVSQADIIYEMPAEDRTTRFLTIFQDYSKIEKLAALRSARPYYMDIAQSYGAVYIHFGGNDPAYDQIDKRSDLIHIDGLKDNWEGTVFFRDNGRRKELGMEYSVYTTGTYLQQALDTLRTQGFNLYQENHPSAFFFETDEEGHSAINGEAASRMEIFFCDANKPWFEYDFETQKYLRFQYGGSQMDGWLNAQIAVDNVLILQMTLTDLGGVTAFVDIDTTGTGSGWFFAKGKYVPITWKKDQYNSEIKYYTLDGNELVVSRGKTFVTVNPSAEDVVIKVQ